MATSPLDLNMFRERLERQRTELTAELTELQDETTNVNQQEGYGVKNHPAEDASDLFSRSRWWRIQKVAAGRASSRSMLICSPQT